MPAQRRRGSGRTESLWRRGSDGRGSSKLLKSPSGALLVMTEPLPDVVWLRAGATAFKHRKGRLHEWALIAVGCLVAATLVRLKPLEDEPVAKPFWGAIAGEICIFLCFAYWVFWKAKNTCVWQCQHCGRPQACKDPERKSPLGTLLSCSKCGNKSRKATTPNSLVGALGVAFRPVWRCQHCGSPNTWSDSDQNAPLGQPLSCRKCGNKTRKISSPK